MDDVQADEPITRADADLFPAPSGWHIKADHLPNTSTPNITDLAPGCALCPYCGGRFFPIALYSMYQVAAALMVSVSRVRAFMSRKDNPLPYRLWARSSRVLSRVIDSRDLDQWLMVARPYPGSDGQSHALKLHAAMVDGARRGGQTTQARIKARRSSPSDPTPEPKE